MNSAFQILILSQLSRNEFYFPLQVFLHDEIKCTYIPQCKALMILQSMKICTYIEQQRLESCISLIGIHFLSSCRTLGRQHSKRPSRRTRRRWRRRLQACICLSTKTTSITKYNVHCLCRQKIKKKICNSL